MLSWLSCAAERGPTATMREEGSDHTLSQYADQCTPDLWYPNYSSQLRDRIYYRCDTVLVGWSMSSRASGMPYNSQKRNWWRWNDGNIDPNCKPHLSILCPWTDVASFHRSKLGFFTIDLQSHQHSKLLGWKPGFWRSVLSLQRSLARLIGSFPDSAVVNVSQSCRVRDLGYFTCWIANSKLQEP